MIKESSSITVLFIYKFIFDRLSIELANDDVNELNSLLLTCIESPDEFFSASMIENLVTRLSKVKNSCVDQVLGFYYLKYEKVWYLLIYCYWYL